MKVMKFWNNNSILIAFISLKLMIMVEGVNDAGPG